MKLCLRAQRLARELRDLAGESCYELLCHKCAVNVDLVERLHDPDNPARCGTHRLRSGTHVLHREHIADVDC